ncbi:hypothetical protein LGQ02_11330 [Bacillus shivajii]|uniref:hypothetical protein n=1 Tax=Bacillus shivajii TaxID=1983719 RepID=UPI001CFB48AC|nr:hypothetical protein [Bacillus shivajii]UCZ51469.1 hypothetical protein LGQ02_11330 [Bacillus shivajii]
MIKKYYKQILYGITIVILLFLLNSQYQEKKMYAEHISQNLNTDIQKVARGVVSNYNTYGEILDSGEITKRQASLLLHYNKDIDLLTNEYGRLAVKFNLLNNDNFNNETHENSREIFSFLFSFTNGEDYELDELDDTLIVLDSNLTETIEYLRELHFNWVKVTEENITGVTINENLARLDGSEFLRFYGEDSVSKSFWVNLLVDLDEQTTKFLKKYEIDNIEQLLDN